MLPITRDQLLYFLFAIAFLAIGTARADGQKPLTEADLTKLIELQIDNQVIVGKLEKEGIKFEATPEVLDRLKKAGASAEVLAAVQKAVASKTPTTGAKI